MRIARVVETAKIAEAAEPDLALANAVALRAHLLSPMTSSNTSQTKFGVVMRGRNKSKSRMVSHHRIKKSRRTKMRMHLQIANATCVANVVISQKTASLRTRTNGLSLLPLSHLWMTLAQSPTLPPTPRLLTRTAQTNPTVATVD